jgi:hypothetical protein
MDRRPSPEFDMRTFQSKLFRYCTIAVCAAVVANGCMLDRRPILSPGTLVPGEYCPGDTLTASYDFLRFAGGSCTPRAGAPDECTTNAPTVTMTSTPALFPPTTRQSYQNSVSFTASGDRIDVGFVYGTGAVFIAPSTLLVNVRDHTETARRIIGTIDSTLPHLGNCARGFAVPTYAPVLVPPGTSPNLGLTRVCNPASNTVSVRVTLGGGATGETFPAALAPGECLDTSAPGVPAFAAAARIIDIAPVGLMCGPGGDGTIEPQPAAPPISTLVSQACR